MYIIQNGKEYVHRIDGLTGQVYWTTDRTAAKRFTTMLYAVEMASGIGRVVPFN